MPETRVPEELHVRLAPPDVVNVVKEVMLSSHTDLDFDRMLILMNHKQMKHKGSVTWACIRVASSLVNAAFAAGAGLACNDEGMDRQVDFVLMIDNEVWAQAPDACKRALIDHELCHAMYDPESDKPCTITHDCEEFASVVRRHGLWRTELQILIDAAKDNAKGQPEKESTDGGNA